MSCDSFSESPSNRRNVAPCYGKRPLKLYTACISSGTQYLPQSARFWSFARPLINAAAFERQKINQKIKLPQMAETEVTNEKHEKI